PLDGPATDTGIEAAEATARAARALAEAARKLGGDAAPALRAAAERVIALLDAPSLPEGLLRVDLLRLLEILAGPEAARARLAPRG
ncbi:MAG TPA: hypothetical protein VE684_06110, partial [Crenalkalicoccus sp.]|nr:hypothetical protein [Crenalkalicoccus sp.]